MVGQRLGEAAVLGEAGAIAGLVRRLLEQPERPALVVELRRRRDASDLEGDALQCLGDRVGLHRAAREVDQRPAATRAEAVPEVVAQSHGAGRVVAHRGNAAVGRTRAERHHDCRARRQPVDPGAGGDRLALRVDTEAAPVALAVDLLVRDRPLDDEHERIQLAARGCVPGPEVVVADVVGEKRVVEGDARLAGDRAAQQLLQARAGRGGQRDRLAVAAEPARQPQDVNDQALDIGAVAREIDRPPHAPTAASVSSSWRAPGSMGERGEMLGCGALQVQRAVSIRDEPGLREACERVGDRGPLGADQTPEQSVRERQGEADAAALDPAPAAGEVPQQQREPHLQPRLRGDRALDVQIGGAHAGT